MAGEKMKNIVLVPDSFKGTMSSAQVCQVMEEQILRHIPDARISKIPVADGGEGSVDCFLAAVGGEKVIVPVKGPYMEEMEGFYGLIDGGKTAVIEMAACAGLPQVGDNLHPDQTTTYGVGQLMADAIGRGCIKLVIGLGGSATNDMGAGAAAALGIKFLNKAGEAFVPVGGILGEIASIDMSGLLPGIRKAEIVAMCDIDNPLYGPNGAAYIFGPQKGADEAMVRRLDGQLQMAAGVVKRDLGIDVADLPGAGAAGGMGAGMVAFFGARLEMGIETVLDVVGFDRLLERADVVFTGEGRLDSQSLRGKVVVGVARRAKAKEVPVLAVVGSASEGAEAAYNEGVTAIFSINKAPIPFSEAKGKSVENLAFTMDSLMRVMRIQAN